MTKKTESYDGFIWVTRGADTDDHLALGGHEVKLGPIMLQHTDKEKVYINVGAHVGTWAIRMADSSAHVYAVEGNPHTYSVLKDNIGLNNLENKVTPVNAVAWDKNDEIVNFVDVNGKDTGGSTRFVEESSGDQRTSTLDTLFGWVPEQIGLISMDVEGSEARVLRGSMDLLRRHRPDLIIELHEGHPGVDDDIRQQVRAILKELEYDFTSFYGAVPEEHIIATPSETTNLMPEVVKAGQDDYAEIVEYLEREKTNK